MHFSVFACADQEGVQGSGPPLENYKICILAILVRTPEKSQSYQATVLCMANIGPQAKRHLNGVSLSGRLWPAYSGIWLLSPLINLKKGVKVGPPLTKLSGSAHDLYMRINLELSLHKSPLLTPLRPMEFTIKFDMVHCCR